ncbi:ATP-binding cassette domain-containing protein [Actinobacteria bacterium YIM 96077]|uniref:Daunorubicin/doxorubicin resistance ABC transporter ATP-binding protein DrrA n=1 Tax=Phytoactinopolyspora halophila TaxID=1981511 RepID=A0A329R444_9ACTN|nr:ATP-binding cassette domain-containing protein [Phytoactinopolyspora halophila]AYY11738.1 ATP-binding cassette domain-containing protein [Actinobacteria bacterium YIM 96077]RAW17828.1 daunorubicin/doxorubicin resistance ABC transporter ATP-binding protein DrrA [Phytoactinopolyspora halophila]
MTHTPVAIRAEGLRKHYKEKRALDGFDLTVPKGMVYGLLGPNGAGKTTAVRILATLVRLDEGQAEVAGHDVVTQPRRVRQKIGFTGQYAAVDEVLTGRQNLRMFGRLFHLGAKRAARRADELLEQFDLVDAADKGLKEYSGGMRRRLDLAASMILAPEILFLDEPTTGLDPRGRNEVWQAIRALVTSGTTVLLTTQYLDEADQLAERIAVIDHGRVIADDAPAHLKSLIGGDRIEVVVHGADDIPAAATVVARVASGEPQIDEENRRLHAPVTDRVAALTEIARTLHDQGVAVEDIGLRRPTLDEVFLSFTGDRSEETAERAMGETVKEEAAV